MRVNVFPAHQVVLFPGGARPLHIFEPRYIEMVEDCIRTKTPMVLASVLSEEQVHTFRPGEPLTFAPPTAGFGYPIVIERRPDGSLTVLLLGSGRVLLGDVIATEQPYIVCEAELLPESPSPLRPIGVQSLQRYLLDWLYRNVPEAPLRSQILQNIRTLDELLACYAHYIIADADFQQLILEENDSQMRIQMLLEALTTGSGPEQTSLLAKTGTS